jgi:hypothetical protein
VLLTLIGAGLLLSACGWVVHYNYGKIVSKAQSAGVMYSFQLPIESHYKATGDFPRRLHDLVKSGTPYAAGISEHNGHFHLDAWPTSMYTRKPLKMITGRGQGEVGNCSYLLLFEPGQVKPFGCLLAFYFPGSNWYKRGGPQDRAYEYFARSNLPDEHHVLLSLLTESRYSSPDDPVPLPAPEQTRVVVVSE